MPTSRRQRARIVDDLLLRTVFWSGSRRPGAVVERFLANEESREIIQSLTAEDFNHVLPVKGWCRSVSFSEFAESTSSKKKKGKV